MDDRRVVTGSWSGRCVADVPMDAFAPQRQLAVMRKSGWVALSAAVAVLIVACSPTDEFEAGTKSESVRTERPSENFPDYRQQLVREFPRRSDDLVQELQVVSGASGPRAPAQEGRFFDVLRTNREVSSGWIIDALRAHPEAQQPGRLRVLLFFALGEVSHPAQVPFLEETIVRCVADGNGLPVQRSSRSSRRAGHHEGDLYGASQSERMETVLALQALEKIVVRDPSPDRIRSFRAALDRVIDERRCHRGAMATAAIAIVRYASDRAAERARLRERLGPELRYLADLEVVHELPGGNAPGRGR